MNGEGSATFWHENVAIACQSGSIFF